MSASREKKIRQDLAAKGITDPKAIREAEEKDQQHRSNMLYGGIAVVFVLVAAFLLLWNSNVLQRGATAVTVDGEKYSAAEVDYFYYNAYSSIRQNQYASYMGIDTSKPLSQQDLSSMAKLMLGVDEDMTWDAYLKQNAKNQLIQMTVLNKAAKDAGFEFTDDMQAQVDKNMDQLASYAKQKGVSTAAYLKNVYGKNMTTSVFKKLLTEGIYVSAYDQSYQNGLSYTDDQIAAYYADNKNDFDVVNYEYILFKGTADSTKDDSGNTVQPTDEQNAAALAAAQEAAAAALSRAKAGGSLEDIAKDYDMATYSSQEEGTYKSSSALSAWVFDASRQSGDCDMVNDGSNYYIALYHSRTRHDYNTVDVRHILFRVDTSDLDSSADDYQTKLDERKAQQKQAAEDALQKWKDGAATEESFAELANELSDDGGSNTAGGLYTEVYKGMMVTEFNDWCFDASRQPGDTGIVANDGSYIGYHVMYFVGTDIPYWQVQVKSAMMSKDYNDWMNSLTENVTATEAGGMKYVG